MSTILIPRTSNGLTVLSDDRIAIREGASTHIVNAKDIVSVHASRSVTHIATRDGAIRLRLPFGVVLDTLRPFGLVQIHRGSAVNIARIRRVVGRGRHRLVVVLESGAEHGVGRGFQSALRARINGATE